MGDGRRRLQPMLVGVLALTSGVRVAMDIPRVRVAAWLAAHVLHGVRFDVCQAIQGPSLRRYDKAQTGSLKLREVRHFGDRSRELADATAAAEALWEAGYPSTALLTRAGTFLVWDFGGSSAKANIENEGTAARRGSPAARGSASPSRAPSCTNHQS